MNIPTKKLKNGFELPVYGLGLWQMGGARERDTSRDTEEVAAIRAALDAGITHVDTAELYGLGHAEELLGQAMQGYDRSKLFIATKVLPEHQTYDGVHRAFEASLKRIGTDYVDLYLLHAYPQSGMSVAETMRAMDELVAQGAIKNIGVCNMTPRRFDETQKHTQNKLVCNQVHYNIQVREVEARGVLEHCQDNDVFCVAWRPLQKGTLPQSTLIDELAKKYDKTPAQIAINWLISQDHVVTICKTSSTEHLKENLGAVGWDMSTEDIERIRAEFPDQRPTVDGELLTREADIEP